MNFKKTKLDNGMTLLMEKMDTVRSVSLGIWVRAGSRDEPAEKSGISHFLEHMFFKGTADRSAQDIAVAIDSLGGELNAYTSREGTTFYIKVLDDFLDTGIGLLADIFLNSDFPSDEVEREKGVVVEEIRMTEDTPDDYVHDIFNLNIWPGHGLGRPVLGTEETVGGFTREDLLAHIGRYYTVDNTIISCAGNFDEARLIGALNKAFAGFGGASSALRDGPVPKFKPIKIVRAKELSEAHICFGIKGIKQSSDDRYAALLLNTVLGGGLSSRLFQEIREKRGLAYSVYSFLSSYKDTGVWGIYAGTAPDKAAEVVNLSVEEIRRLSANIREDELQRARTQVMGNIMLGLESTSRRMQNIANQEIYYGRYFSPDEVIASINSITLEKARELSRDLVEDSSPAVVALGALPVGLEEDWAGIRL